MKYIITFIRQEKVHSQELNIMQTPPDKLRAKNSYPFTSIIWNIRTENRTYNIQPCVTHGVFLVRKMEWNHWHWRHKDHVILAVFHKHTYVKTTKYYFLFRASQAYCVCWEIFKLSFVPLSLESWTKIIWLEYNCVKILKMSDLREETTRPEWQGVLDCHFSVQFHDLFIFMFSFLFW